VGPQRGDRIIAEGDGAARCNRLRLRDHRAAGDPLQGPADLNHSAVEVDRPPAQREELATAHAGEPGQQEESLQPVAACHGS
jgi:hypothetical protein